MKEKIELLDYSEPIIKALPKGILLNTNGDKFNSMVIGWAHIGRMWNRTTFHVYVRQSRYTHDQMDKTGEFTVSIPLGEPDPLIAKVCGVQSGFDVDKVTAAKLDLVEPSVNHTPAIRQYPLTIECRILYAQDQEVDKIPASIADHMYPENGSGVLPKGTRDVHTMYVGEILDAYLIR